MNKIDVLYKNLNFKTGRYQADIDENYDVPIFASDAKLVKLLNQASIKNYDSTQDNYLRNVSSTKVNSHFKKHPRYITEDSLISFDSPREKFIDRDKVDKYMKTLKFKHHTKCEDDEISVLPYNIINVLNSPHLNDSNFANPRDIRKKKEETMNIKDKFPPKMTKNIESAKEHLEEKINSYLIKICSWMQETYNVIQSGITPIEGAEDYGRRQKRTVEFSSRFARNYSYQLGRQLTELHRSTFRIRSGAPPPARTLVAACQTVLQAVQAYCNHTPATICAPSIEETGGNANSSVHNKFSEFLKDTCELCRVIKIFGVCPTKGGIIEEVETNSKTLIKQIQDTLMKSSHPEPKPVQRQTKISLIQREKKRSYNVPFQKQHPLESRLSMYSVALGKNQKGVPMWKKNAAKLVKQRLPVQSRYLKPKPSLEPIQLVDQKPAKPLARKCSSLLDNSSPRSDELTKPNEDDIQTMVQVDTSKNLQVMVSTPNSFRNRLKPLLQTLETEISVGKEEKLLERGFCDDVLKKLGYILDQVQRPFEDGFHSKQQKNKINHDAHITITGPKNAKLICIKDKSLFESKTEVEPVEIQPEPEPEKCPRSLSILPFQNNASNVALRTPKIQNITNIPKEFTINIIRYKFNFYKYTKPNILYKKSSQVYPWNLTSKVSDDLISYLLDSIITEVDLNDLVDKVYRSEFETH